MRPGMHNCANYNRIKYDELSEKMEIDARKL
jgi:hypothetical protein